MAMAALGNGIIDTIFFEDHGIQLAYALTCAVGLFSHSSGCPFFVFFSFIFFLPPFSGLSVLTFLWLPIFHLLFFSFIIFFSFFSFPPLQVCLFWRSSGCPACSPRCHFFSFFPCSFSPLQLPLPSKFEPHECSAFFFGLRMIERRVQGWGIAQLLYGKHKRMAL